MSYPLLFSLLVIALIIFAVGVDGVSNDKSGSGFTVLVGIVLLLIFAGGIHIGATESAIGISAGTGDLKENWTYLAVATPTPEDSLTWVLKRPDGELQMFRLEQRLCAGALYTARNLEKPAYTTKLVLVSGPTC